MGLENIGNAPLKTLNHAIGFGHLGLGQTPPNVQLLTKHLELVIATGLTTGKETIHELLAVIRQPLGDLDRAGFVQSISRMP